VTCGKRSMPRRSAKRPSMRLVAVKTEDQQVAERSLNDDRLELARRRPGAVLRGFWRQ
jgi:hypothetical protein